MMTYEAVEKMNDLHKKSKSMFIVLGIVWGVGVVGLIVSSIIAVMVNPNSSLWAIFFIWIFAGTIYVAGRMQPQAKAAEREMRSLYKDTFLNGLLNEYFDNAKYRAELGFTQTKVEEFGIYQMGNRFDSEDQLIGDYQGVHFEQSDVHIWKHVDSDNDSDIEYFYGRMFVFDIPFKYSHSVKVYNKTILSTEKDYRIHEKKDKIVKMESVKFNDVFTVYSEDAHEAFYILTPAMMEKLMDIYYKYCKIDKYIYQDIAFRFEDGKLYFTMKCSSKAFEPGAFPICYPDEKKKIKKDIQVIIDLIESLDLVDKDALAKKEEEAKKAEEAKKEEEVKKAKEAENVEEVEKVAFGLKKPSESQEDFSNDTLEEETKTSYSGGLRLKL